MLSAKEQNNYINRLIKQHNLIPISKQVKKRYEDLILNSTNTNILMKELEKPLSDLNMNDLENRALILYMALINPKRFHLSKEKTKEIPDMILSLASYAREQAELKKLSGEKDKSFNRRKSAKFFVGLLICLRNYLQNNKIGISGSPGETFNTF